MRYILDGHFITLNGKAQAPVVSKSYLEHLYDGVPEDWMPIYYGRSYLVSYAGSTQFKACPMYVLAHLFMMFLTRLAIETISGRFTTNHIFGRSLRIVDSKAGIVSMLRSFAGIVNSPMLILRIDTVDGADISHK